MKIKDIKIGETYIHKENIGYRHWYAQPVKILKPKQDENTKTYTLVKCKWSSNPSFMCGIMKYFRPGDLIPYKN